MIHSLLGIVAASPAAPTPTVCDFVTDCNVKAVAEMVQKNPDTFLPADPGSGALYRKTVQEGGTTFALLYRDSDRNGLPGSGDSLQLDIMMPQGKTQMYQDEGLNGFVVPVNHRRSLSEAVINVPLGDYNEFKDGDWYKVEQEYKENIRRIGITLRAARK